MSPKILFVLALFLPTDFGFYRQRVIEWRRSLRWNSPILKRRWTTGDRPDRGAPRDRDTQSSETRYTKSTISKPSTMTHWLFLASLSLSFFSLLYFGNTIVVDSKLGLRYLLPLPLKYSLGYRLKRYSSVHRNPVRDSHTSQVRREKESFWTQDPVSSKRSLSHSTPIVVSRVGPTSAVTKHQSTDFRLRQKRPSRFIYNDTIFISYPSFTLNVRSN